jgi:HEAT repeat protein
MAREELARIGPWSVPSLSTALRKASGRVRLNGVIALMLIRDPRGLPALRAAAKEDDDVFIRRAATLAIGTFECPGDFATLRSLRDGSRGEWRAVAPALARLHHKDSGAILNAAAAPKSLRGMDARDAAAVVLAAAIVGPDAPPTDLLEHEEKLVQEAAAIGLALRPLPEDRAGEIIRKLERSKLEKAARVLAIRALGAIHPRPREAEAKLLDLACRDGDADERIVALIELAGGAAEYAELAKAYGKLEGRNDPVAAALLFALARTGEDKAIHTLRDVVRRGSSFLQFYAGASLLYANGTEELDPETFRDIAALGGELQRIAQMMASPSKHGKAAFAELRAIKDERNLRLFVLREERNWLEANRLLARIFELDAVLLQLDAAAPGRTPDSPLGGGGGGDEGRKPPSGSSAEQDLLDILLPPDAEPPSPERKPYFWPGDRGG